MINRGRVLLAIATVLLAVFVYEGVLRQLFEPLIAFPRVPGGLPVLTAILTTFSLTHAAYALGWRHAAAFFAITAVVSWAFEQVGVETGAIYGRYHYTDVLGIKLGHVPILIPLAWFMMIYPSYVITNLIVEARSITSWPRIGPLIAAAALGAFVMTAWDLVIDPILSGPDVRAWVWEEGGPYFGIPIQNFVGWIATVFSVFVVYRVVERAWARRPEGSVSAAIAFLPLVAYGSMLLANLQLSAAPDALWVIGPMAMGIPLLAASIRLAGLSRA